MDIGTAVNTVRDLLVNNGPAVIQGVVASGLYDWLNNAFRISAHDDKLEAMSQKPMDEEIQEQFMTVLTSLLENNPEYIEQLQAMLCSMSEDRASQSVGNVGDGAKVVLAQGSNNITIG